MFVIEIDSTPRKRRTKTTTKALLGPLSVAFGEKDIISIKQQD